jgi:predicted Zn-ribbon and HTH transcriptional regulator
MARVTLEGFRCERCGHEWVPRDKGQEPTVCPKCKSPYWNKPRKSEEIAPLVKK